MAIMNFTTSIQAFKASSISLDEVVKRVPVNVKVPEDVLRVFSAISAPENADVFSVESALKAFEHLDDEE